MNHLLCRGILLAQGNRLESMSSRFRRGGSHTQIDGWDILVGLLVLAGIGVFVWFLSYAIRLQEKGRGLPSPFGLFLQLCKAHQLRWSQRWLLWRLARAQRLRDPARVFLEPERYEPAHLSPALQPRAAELEELRGRLFFQADEEKDDDEATQPALAEPAPTAASPGHPAPALDIPPWPPTSGTPAAT